VLVIDASIVSPQENPASRERGSSFCAGKTTWSRCRRWINNRPIDLSFSARKRALNEECRAVNYAESWRWFRRRLPGRRSVAGRRSSRGQQQRQHNGLQWEPPFLVRLEPGHWGHSVMLERDRPNKKGPEGLTHRASTTARFHGCTTNLQTQGKGPVQALQRICRSAFPGWLSLPGFIWPGMSASGWKAWPTNSLQSRNTENLTTPRNESVPNSFDGLRLGRGRKIAFPNELRNVLILHGDSPFW